MLMVFVRVVVFYDFDMGHLVLADLRLFLIELFYLAGLLLLVTDCGGWKPYKLF